MTGAGGTAVTRAESPTAVVADMEKTASLLKTQWGGSTNMELADFHAIAVVCRDAGMDPIFDMDILGGKPYDKADYWKGLIASHPDVVSVVPTALEFGTSEFKEWIGITTDGVVAAAYMVEIVMSSRAAPIVEANYVKMTDPLLYSFDEAKFAGEGADRTKAKELAGETGSVFYNKNPKPWEKRGWYYRTAHLDADWQGTAKKKCRTIVMRRVGKMAIPKEYGRVMKAMNEIQQVLEAREIKGPSAHVTSPKDPYGESEEVPTTIGTTASSEIVSETDRRRLMSEAQLKGLNIDGVKIMGARLLDMHPDGFTTSEITYVLFEQMMAEISDLPEPEREIVQEAGVEKRVNEAGPGLGDLFPESL